jgi:hypothetical protein
MQCKVLRLLAVMFLVGLSPAMALAGWFNVVIEDGYKNLHHDLMEISGKPIIGYVKEQSGMGYLRLAFSSTASGVSSTDWKHFPAGDVLSDNVVGGPCVLATLGGLPVLAYGHSSLGLGLLGSTSCTGQVWYRGNRAGIASPGLTIDGIRNLGCRLTLLAERVGAEKPFSLLGYKVAGVWDSVSLPYAGRGASFEVVNAQPAIAFFGVSSGDVYFAQRATSGLWPIASQRLAVDSNGLATNYHHAILRIVESKPYLMFAAQPKPGESGGLRFVKALDINGSAWESTYGVISGSAGTGPFSGPAVFDLEVSNGVPMIAYRHVGGQDLLFSKADVTGRVWDYSDPERAILGQDPRSVDLEIISGNPAVSFSIAASAEHVSQLYYARKP